MEIAARQRILSARLALLPLLLLAAAASGACMKSDAPQEASTATIPPAAAHPPSLECLLGAPRNAVVGKPIEISFVLQNTGPHEVWVLRWQTPLEDFRADVLHIEGPDGKVIEYQGPMSKRGDPSAEEYIHLDSGASTERVVDLGAAYPITAPGKYRISFSNGLMDAASTADQVPHRRDQLRRLALSCPAIDFEVGPATP